MTRPRWTLAVSAGVVVMGTLPGFLVGVYAVDIKDEFGVGASALGLLLALYFGTSAVLSAVGGAVVERVGARIGMAICLVGVSVAGLLITAVAHSFVVLVALMMVSAAVHAASHPATNLAVATHIPAARRGLAFGIKQAAIPAATFLAGLTVPAFGARFGWRISFLLLPLAGAALLAALGLRVPAAHSGGRDRSAPRTSSRHLVVIAAAVALAVGGVHSVGVFFVAWGVDEGMSAERLAVILSAVSLGGIAMRMFAGWVADRRPSMAVIPAVTAFITVGACGVAALAAASGYLLATVGVAVALMLGWSWNGLLHHAVVRLHPEAPAYASSVTQSGLFVGVAFGPLVFGLVAEHLSFSTAWLISTGLMLVGAVLMISAYRMIGGERPLAPSAPSAEAAPRG